MAFTQDTTKLGDRPVTLVAQLYDSVTQTHKVVPLRCKDNGDGSWSMDIQATIETGDIEIGAVELKDAGSDTRVKVKTDGTDNALVVMQNNGAKETGGNLASIKTDVDKIPSKGTATMVGSMPVTIATDDTLMSAMKADLDKIPSSPATEGGNLATIAGKDFATQTTLSALNAKIPASPATEGGNLATIKSNTDKLDTTLSALATAIAGATPKTLADVVSAISGISVGGNKITPIISVVDMTTLGTEYSQALPEGCSGFTVQLREDSGILKIAFNTGDIAAGTYITVKAGGSWSEDGVNLTGKTLYLVSDTNAVNAEIIAWAPGGLA